jgi:hypothetical protein
MLHNETMHTLYESDSFCVTHMFAEPHTDASDLRQGESSTEQSVPTLMRHGFEIVDKRSGKEVYLDGSWAEMFHQKISAWQRSTPTQEEVEDTLDSYTGLAQSPVGIH